EPEPDSAHPGLDEPIVADSFDRGPEPGRPLRQVRRIGRVVVDGRGRSVDPLRDVPRFALHSAGGGTRTPTGRSPPGPKPGAYEPISPRPRVSLQRTRPTRGRAPTASRPRAVEACSRR